MPYIQVDPNIKYIESLRGAFKCKYSVPHSIEIYKDYVFIVIDYNDLHTWIRKRHTLSERWAPNFNALSEHGHQNWPNHPESSVAMPTTDNTLLAWIQFSHPSFTII